ncbi:MAG: 1-acyl-sn-glycerol-3-phosphate acyltransferase [Spirochaetales bacterium]|nr:1-acyl-sn-glycerol-3-phosphate acyltransferase [Spirochaetales bacterium]MCF7938689.1 1-acyl-sn-glycerol-3-phosphate acyltransferase [Spirochaetales bacterium]
MGKKRRKIIYSRAFYLLLRNTLARHFTRRRYWVCENCELPRKIKPPYLVMPNHNCPWDPFTVGYFVPHPVQYVVADAQFRNRLMRFVLGLVGSVPKTKSMSDMESLRNIMDLKKRGAVIGIFPEGQSPWDGHALPVIESTSKLIKLLKVPVIVPLIQGSYLTRPRWAKKLRHGRVTVTHKLAFTPEEIKKMKPDEIHQRLAGYLDYDEYEFQKKHMYRYDGTDRAENLEFALFACPACGGLSTMRSKKNDYRCTSCGFAVRYDVYGMFDKLADGNPDAGREAFDSTDAAVHQGHGSFERRRLHPAEEPFFRTIRDWNLWQLGALHEWVDQYRHEPPGTLLHSDGGIKFSTGYRDHPLVLRGNGRLDLYTDRLEFSVESGRASGRRFTFPFTKLNGINVQNNEKLEFYYNNLLYSFDGYDNLVAGYKWLMILRYLQESSPRPSAS